MLAIDDPDVDVKYIALNAKGERQQRLFHTSSQKGNKRFQGGLRGTMG